MSDSTKQTLAITLGALGLVIGIVAAIVAYDAKNAASSNEEVTQLVDQRFAEFQARQKKQASQAEKLVAGLTAGEKNLVRKINANAAAIKQLKRKNRNLTSQVNTLSSDYQSLSAEVSDLKAQVQKNFNTLNTRIDKVNTRIDNINQRTGGSGGGASP